MATDLAAPGRSISAIWRCHRRPQARTRLARRSLLPVQAELLPRRGRSCSCGRCGLCVQIRHRLGCRILLREAGRRGRAKRKRGQQVKNSSNRTFSAHYRTFSKATSAKSERGRQLRQFSLIPDAVFLLLERQAGAIPMVFHRSPGKKMTGLRALDVGFVVARVSARSGVGKRGPAGRGASDLGTVA